MTSKQIKKIPISIFFSNYQISKNYRKTIFDEYSSYSIFNDHFKVTIIYSLPCPGRLRVISRFDFNHHNLFSEFKDLDENF